LSEAPLGVCIYCHRFTTDPPRECNHHHGHDYCYQYDYVEEAEKRRSELEEEFGGDS